MTIDDLKSRLEACNHPLLVGPLAKALPSSDHDLVIYVDGGEKLRSASSGQPSLSVGDGDSSKTGASLDFKIPTEKDFSDLAFVLNHLPKAIRSVKLVGFIGGRLDHQLAVFGEVYYFLKRVKADHVIFDDQQLIFLDSGAHDLNIRGQFSVMAFEACEVRLTGKVKYPIDPVSTIQPMSSFGLSNIGSGQIKIENSDPLLVIQGRASQDRLPL
ncbi:MAG: hypothetical protein AAF202_08425 [Pseudomonadota bacterium]